MKKLLLIVLLSLFAYGESIDRYLIDLNVSNSGRLSVVEDIKYNFGTSANHHGIYRDIPLNGTKIKDIRVLQNGFLATYKSSKLRDGRNEYIRIRVGDANRYVRGVVEYKISYKIDGYVVRNSGEVNQIIVDLVGTGWSVPIKNISAKVYLPSSIENSANIKVYRGIFGSKEELNFTKSSNSIAINLEYLRPYEGLTIALEFDKALIKADTQKSNKYYNNSIYYLFLAPIIGLFIYFIRKFNIFKSTGAIPVKYRAPKDLSILEAGLLKDNFVDFKEIKPAILELANLGFITMKDVDGELYLQRSNKSKNSLKRDQKLLLNEIFGNANEISSKDIEITNNFLVDIKNVVHKSLISRGLFSSSVRKARESFIFIAILVSAVSIGGFLFYIFSNSGGLEFIFPFLFMSVFVAVGIHMLVTNIKSGEYVGAFISIIWIVASSLFMYNIIYSKALFISVALIVAIAVIGIYFIYKKIDTLSFKGALAKRNLLGLKEFINRAEKEKIDFFLKEDREYLNKLLPYAVLFGANKHWLELYKELDTPLPTWYDGDLSTFDSIDFNVGHYTPETSSSSSIGSSDFGSFGGFSGGGVGGGGGGSW